MGLSDYFLNNFETSDNPKDKRLTTHYYTNDLERTTALIKKAVDSTCFALINEDTMYNELLLEFKNIRVVVTLFRVSLYETRVDMIVNTNYLVPFKRGIKIINDLYTEFDKVLTLKYKGGQNV